MAKKNMLLATLISLMGLLISAAVFHFAEYPAAFSAAVAFGTTFYHLGVRLAVGYLIDRKYHNQMDYTNSWFRPRSFEKGLYKKLQVKRWKKWLPTYNPEDFRLKDHSVAEILQTSCQAEVVHEINMVLSWVPVVFSVWFGSLGVFLITSCAAFLFDGVFVIIQRYNRPRLLRLLRR